MSFTGVFLIQPGKVVMSPPPALANEDQILVRPSKQLEKCSEGLGRYFDADKLLCTLVEIILSWVFLHPNITL